MAKRRCSEAYTTSVSTRRCSRRARCRRAFFGGDRTWPIITWRGRRRGQPGEGGVREADLLAVGEHHAVRFRWRKQAHARGTSAPRRASSGPADRPGRTQRAGAVEQRGVERRRHLHVVGPRPGAGGDLLAQVVGDRPRHREQRRRRHRRAAVRGDVEQQGDEPAGVGGGVELGAHQLAGRLAHPPPADRVLGQPAQGARRAQRRRRRRRAARSRRGARSRGWRRRPWRRAGARRRRPRTAPSAGSRPSSAGRTRRPGGRARSARRCSGVRPWCAVTPSWSGTGVAR